MTHKLKMFAHIKIINISTDFHDYLSQD